MQRRKWKAVNAADDLGEENTTQHSTAQHSTAQHSTAQHNNRTKKQMNRSPRGAMNPFAIDPLKCSTLNARR
jgi:hypothetical protein